MTVCYRQRRKQARKDFFGLCDTKHPPCKCPDLDDLDAVVEWILKKDV